MTVASQDKTDEQLQRDVLTALRWNRQIDAARIGVAASGGIVTLSGSVDCYLRRWHAERTARRVAGVRAVVNELQVKPPGEQTLSDDEVAADAVCALKWNLLVPSRNIKVSVSDGWVTLDGEVMWSFQKELAEDAVRSVRGVKGVWVKPRASSEDGKR